MVTGMSISSVGLPKFCSVPPLEVSLEGGKVCSGREGRSFVCVLCCLKSLVSRSSPLTSKKHCLLPGASKEKERASLMHEERVDGDT